MAFTEADAKKLKELQENFPRICRVSGAKSKREKFVKMEMGGQDFLSVRFSFWRIF